MSGQNGRPTRALLWLYAAGLCVPVLSSIGLAGCNNKPTLSEDSELVVWVSGDTQGYLEPCGCRRDQAGGLPARMTLVTQEQKPNRLLVDVGNLTSGGRAYELLKLDYLMRGMVTMGYDAVNLGKREVNLDRDTLLQKITAGKLPFVSCNVLNAQTQQPLTAPSLVKTFGGLRVGITGVVEAESDSVGPGLRVRPPEEALAALLPQLKGQCDHILVLAFAPQETLHRIAARFPEIGTLLGGDVPQSSGKAETINRTDLFHVTGKGKVIGRLNYALKGGSLVLLESKAYKTEDKLSPAPAMTALIKEFKDTLRERNIELAAAEGLDAIHTEQTTADTYVGQDKCQPCHATSHKVTLASTHSHAYETLVKKNSEYDPECLRCHTVGYGAQDGFVNLEKTPHFQGVQCENCHGRGKAHIEAVQSGKQGKAATQMLKVVTPNSCVRCHDKENSYNFNYATFWPKIKHGDDAKRTAELRAFLTESARSR
jgi:hypothetical protein